MSPSVAIVLVNYNGKSDTLECLQSLESLTYPNYTVVLVDQASGDGTVAAVREKFPAVHCIENPVNNGFAGGNNVGIRYALEEYGAEYVFLLNNDTMVAPDLLDVLVARIEADAGLGIVAPTMFYYSTPEVVWAVGGWLEKRGDATLAGEGLSEAAALEAVKQRPPDYLIGCGILVRRAVFLNIGLLDEAFFLYYEESDFCARARRAGWQLAHEPKGRLWHKVSQTTGKDSPLTLYYMRRNALLYLERNGTRGGVLAALVDDLYLAGVWSVRRDKRRGVLLAAVVDYLRRRFGRSERVFAL